MTVILGLSAFYHDSAAAITRDGKIVAAAQEERFTRKKQDASFPKNAVHYCVKEAAVSWTVYARIVLVTAIGSERLVAPEFLGRRSVSQL